MLVQDSELYEGQNPKFDVFKRLIKGSDAPEWLLEGVAKEWNHPVKETNLKLIAISENATFLLRRNGIPVAVARVSEPDYVGGPLAINSELSWINALHDIDGVNLVTPIPTAHGEYVAEIPEPTGQIWSVILTNYIDGTVLENLDDPSACYRVIGEWSAKFHNQAREWVLPKSFYRFSWDIPDIVGVQSRWGRWENADGLSRQEKELIQDAMWEAISYVVKQPRNRNTWGLIHADLRHSNIIRREDGELVVIDFDDCGFSWYLWDFAASLTFIEHESYAPKLISEWVGGYRSVSELTDDDLEMMGALSMLRRIQMLGWTTRHRADALPEGLYDAQKPGCLMCSDHYLHDHLWLFKAAGIV